MSRENNGSSYLLFTIGTVGLGAISVLIDQQAGTQGARVWFAIAATLLYVINLVGIISLFWREWIAQLVEISPTSWEPRFFGYRIPWRLYRIVDHYIGLNIAFSLLWMTFWVWDPSDAKETYFTFPPSINSSNHWAVWLSFIETSFAVFNGVGFAEFQLASTATVALTTWHVMWARPIDLVVAAIVVSESFELVQERKRAQNAGAEKRAADTQEDDREREMRALGVTIPVETATLL